MDRLSLCSIIGACIYSHRSSILRISMSAAALEDAAARWGGSLAPFYIRRLTLLMEHASETTTNNEVRSRPPPPFPFDFKAHQGPPLFVVWLTLLWRHAAAAASEGRDWFKAPSLEEIHETIDGSSSVSSKKCLWQWLGWVEREGSNQRWMDHQCMYACCLLVSRWQIICSPV